MIDSAEVERFAKNPSQLVELCREVIGQLDNDDDTDDDRDDASDKEKEMQLMVIAKSIEQLEKVGVPVPDSLRAEKTKLAALLGTRSEIKQTLDLLYAEFDAMTKTIKSMLQNYGGLAQSTSPNTPRQFYREYIICSLQKFGGSATSTAIQEEILRQVNNLLIPGDFELCPGKKGNMKRWNLNLQNERGYMVKDGIIKSDSPVGIWELAEDHK